MNDYHTVPLNDPEIKEVMALLHMFGYVFKYAPYVEGYLRIRTSGKYYYHTRMYDTPTPVSELLDVLIKAEGD